MDQPPGAYPLVFETGVISFDEEGALHVHLSHGPDAPHPVQTHPEGQDGHVPPRVSRVELVGDAARGAVHGGLLPTDQRPTGLEVVVRGYRSVKLEASGDLTVVLEGVKDPPAWFTAGKVHRFAGPDGPPRLWSGSAPPPVRKVEPRPAPASPPKSSTASPASSTTARGSGCAVLFALLLLGTAASLLA